MKKRLMVVMCSLMMVFGMNQNVMAKSSPTGTKVTTEAADKTAKAPKTGEGNAAVYALAAALMLTGSAVVSRKRLNTGR